VDVAEEILAFANFNFEISKIRMKVIEGGEVRLAERYVLNWPEYIGILEQKRLGLNRPSRDLFSKYEIPRPDQDVFISLNKLQAEIREILDVICLTKTIPLNVWETIFRQADHLKEVFFTDPPVEGCITEDDFQSLDFKKYIKAESYRTCLFGELRNLIVDKTVFRLRKCPECSAYFLDRTKNGSKVYCSSQSCGNRAKQRAYYRRQRDKVKAQAELDQHHLDFTVKTNL